MSGIETPSGGDGLRTRFARKPGGVVATADATWVPLTPIVSAPLAAAPKKKRKSILQYEFTPKKIKGELVMNLSRQLSSFVRAGVPLIDALEVVKADATNKKFLEVMDDLIVRIRAGASFGEAVHVHRDAFPKFFASMVGSAELTGRLDEVLDQIAQYLDRDLETRRKVKSAMSYPAVIGVMSIFTVLVLSIYVLPKFKTFFEGFDAELPITTRALLGFTDFMSAYGRYIAIFFVSLPVLYMIGLKFEGFKFRRDAFLLRIPQVGKLIKLGIIERFSRLLSVMVQAGVPLPDAVEVAGAAAGNRMFRKDVARIKAEMIKGSGLAAPIAQSKLFPPAARQMIRVGESTGTLDTQLQSTAHYYSRELEYKLRRFTDLFEPMMIVFMGLSVGFVAVALVSAMYGIFNQVDL